MLSVTFGVKIHAQTKKEGNRMEPESDSEGKCLHIYICMNILFTLKVIGLTIGGSP